LAEADRVRAAGMANDHMRGTLERSAAAWSSRADLLGRLEASVSARAKIANRTDDRIEREDNGQGTGSFEQGEAQAEGEFRQADKAARPRIKGLSVPSDRKDADEA